MGLDTILNFNGHKLYDTFEDALKDAGHAQEDIAIAVFEDNTIMVVESQEDKGIKWA